MVSVFDRSPCCRAGAAAVFAAALLLAGCALFDAGETAGLPTASTARQGLPALRVASDAIQLQIVFIERPVDDVLASRLVWQEIDQVGALPPATRMLLLDHGFRVGQAGASPPPALQTLLGLTVEIHDHDATDERLMRGRRLGLRNGQDTEIRMSEILPDCRMQFLKSSQSELMEYTQAQCVLRLKPVRQQDGWVRLEFTPEIHHGEARMRAQPNEEGWALMGGQKVDVRHALKFSVMLSTGEFAIIGSLSDHDDTPGRAFFTRDTEKNGRSQRVLVVRLADAGRVPLDEAGDR